MGMFGPKPGYWYVTSKTDPRWNGEGRSDGLLFSSGPPPEVKSHIKRLEKHLGTPPEDLEWGGMKD
jgi:hypothetical protein